MLNKDNERELAYVVRVGKIESIEGYDRVEFAHINGWGCVVGKDAFKEGDLGVYFEIDSKCPKVEPFLFLEKKHYKIRTQKMCKRVSQGLLMPFSEFGWSQEDHKEGDFLTKELGITYAEAEDNARKAHSPDKYKRMAQRYGKLFSKQPYRFLMQRTWGKKLLFLILGNYRDKRGWPVWVKKTDEERIENMPWILENKDPWVATEKIDGTSTTFTIKRKPFGKHEFYVCSRNVVFDKPDKKCFYDTNVYLEMAEKYNVEHVLKDLLKRFKDAKWITLQGETYGGLIQKRDYSMSAHDFKGFNLITSTEGRWDSVRASKLMADYNIPWVPILDENYILPDTVEELRDYVNSEASKVDGLMREGVVFRSQDGSQSFKCVSPDYLMKYHL